MVWMRLTNGVRTLIRSPWFWGASVILIGGGGFFWYSGEAFLRWTESFFLLIGETETLAHMVDWLGWAGPLGLIAINAAQIIIAPLPNYAIFVVAGLLYGPVWGGIYGMTGMVAGGICAMLLTRRYGRPLAERMVGTERLDRWSNMHATQSILSWSILFLAPVGDFPYFLAGLSRISVAKVVAISAITRGPTIFLIAAASSGAMNMTWPQLALIILALVVIFGLLAVYQKQVLAWVDQHISPRFAPLVHRAMKPETKKINQASVEYIPKRQV